MSFSAFDHLCMAEALRLAEQGLYTTRPNPRVGHAEVIEGGETHADRPRSRRITATGCW
jgi:diaminohydroxyphosphoribosylaminopyrimidine deaminase / 5-amino-6-(5-phosphoribosylamino)uracil reductase